MEKVDPTDAVSQAQAEQKQRTNDSAAAFRWFRRHYEEDGTLVSREDAVGAVAEECNISSDRARGAVRGLVSDILDPVQLVIQGGERYVGILDYTPFESEGGYGYVEYDDLRGECKNLVCGKCVEEYEYDSEPWRAVEGVGRHDVGVEWGPMLDHLTEHYVSEHTSPPEEVEVAASLVSGTTIAANTAYHGGNESGMSFYDGTNLTAPIDTPSANIDDLGGDGIALAIDGFAPGFGG